MKKIAVTLVLMGGLTLSGAALANPPIWESSYGDNSEFRADDDGFSQALPFDFPFAGQTYNSIHISSNGGVELGNDGIYNEGYIDYDIWDSAYFESDFANVGSPMLLVFNTDLDNEDGETGDIYYKGDATKAVVTWVGMAGNVEDETPFATFQLILYPNGDIVYGYKSLQRPIGAATGHGVVVGVSDGSGAPYPGSMDLSVGGDTGTSPHAYQIWCSAVDPIDDCFEPEQPTTAVFDLENKNVIFKPNETGGFTVTSRRAGSGGGALSPALLLLALGGLALRRRRA